MEDKESRNTSVRTVRLSTYLLLCLVVLVFVVSPACYFVSAFVDVESGSLED